MQPRKGFVTSWLEIFQKKRSSNHGKTRTRRVAASKTLTSSCSHQGQNIPYNSKKIEQIEKHHVPCQVRAKVVSDRQRGALLFHERQRKETMGFWRGDTWTFIDTQSPMDFQKTSRNSSARTMKAEIIQTRWLRYRVIVRFTCASLSTPCTTFTNCPVGLHYKRHFWLRIRQR